MLLAKIVQNINIHKKTMKHDNTYIKSTGNLHPLNTNRNNSMFSEMNNNNNKNVGCEAANLVFVHRN